MSADLRCLQAEHLRGRLEAVQLQSQSVDRHNSLQTDTDLLVAWVELKTPLRELKMKMFHPKWTLYSSLGCTSINMQTQKGAKIMKRFRGEQKETATPCSQKHAEEKSEHTWMMDGRMDGRTKWHHRLISSHQSTRLFLWPSTFSRHIMLIFSSLL